MRHLIKTKFNNCFRGYVHIKDVCSNEDRVWHSSARSDKLYGKTCQQGVIQSGLRQDFHFHLEGPFLRAYGQNNRADSLVFLNYKGKRVCGVVILST